MMTETIKHYETSAGDVSQRSTVWNYIKVWWFPPAAQDPRQGWSPPSSQLQVSCCFPRPWAAEAGAACVRSGVGGTIWWFHMQWPRTSVLYPSLKQITETKSRIAAEVPSSSTDDCYIFLYFYIFLESDFLSPQLTIMPQSLGHFKPDLLKSQTS